jgi:methyl-accepting chemotaxis protein
MGINNFKMQTKLLLLSCVGAFGMLVVGVISTNSLNQANHSLEDLNQGIHNVKKFAAMKNRLLTTRLDVVYMMSLEDDARLAEKNSDMKSQIQAIEALVKEAEAANLEPKEKGWLTSFKEGSAAYAAQGGRLAEMLVSAHKSRDNAALKEAVNFGVTQVAPLYIKPAEAIDALENYNVEQSESAFDAATKTERKQIAVNIAVVVAIIVISILICLMISRAITRALNDVFQTMAAIAGGDLTVSSSVTSTDEMGMLGKEMNSMRLKLSEIIRRLADNGISVSSSAIQMHSTAEQMATSTEELAAQAATIATACEEMSATSTDIARNCHFAADESAKANSAAEAGARVVDDTVLVMGKIAQRVRASAQTIAGLGSRSDQIGAIVGTIEDIADQTNLLALNAAIEAARAGEQGRGFAVVADEVRALAERTTRATREISEMIKNIQTETQSAVSTMNEGVREVEQGTSEAARSGDALRHILERISSVTDQVNQIAVAAEEQTATTMEINQNIQQITDVANMTATSSHEEAAAANQLARLAEDLKDMVGQFKYL